MKISIITSAFNAAATIERTIRSVLQEKQGSASVEYVVIDGGSTDGTLEIINKYKDEIDVLRSGPDDGIFDGMNRGLKECTGEIIGILNADDEFVPGVLDRVLEVAPKAEKHFVIYGGLIWREGDQVIGASPSELFDPSKTRPYEMPVAHPATFVSKGCYDDFGLFDCAFPDCADRDLILRLCRNEVKFVECPYYLTAMEKNGSSHVNFGRTQKDILKVVERWGGTREDIETAEKLYSDQCRRMRMQSSKNPILSLLRGIKRHFLVRRLTREGVLPFS